MTKKLTKAERASRERGLITAIAAGLTATREDQAKAWALDARELRKGLTKAAIRRAERIAHRIAEDRPPGFVVAMEALDLYEELCLKHDMPKHEQERAWGAVAQVCMFQLGARSGPFYDAAVAFGIAQRVDPVVVNRVPTPGCKCPSCRPRRPEELN